MQCGKGNDSYDMEPNKYTKNITFHRQISFLTSLMAKYEKWSALTAKHQ